MDCLPSASGLLFALCIDCYAQNELLPSSLYEPSIEVLSTPYAMMEYVKMLSRTHDIRILLVPGMVAHADISYTTR